VNTDVKNDHSLVLEEAAYRELGGPAIDLLGQPTPEMKLTETGQIEVRLAAGECFCLGTTPEPLGLRGHLYRQRRAQAAWAITTLRRRFRVRDIGTYDWRWLAECVHAEHRGFLGAMNHLDPVLARSDLEAAVRQCVQAPRYPQVVTWRLGNQTRVTLVSDEHWLLIEDDTPFRAVLKPNGASVPQHVSSIQVRNGHIACFPPGQTVGVAELTLERYASEDQFVQASVLFLAAEPSAVEAEPAVPRLPAVALLTNSRGGMARLPVDLAVVQSKYDCVLGANLHPTVPVDRHIFVKRARVWVTADGFVSPLHADNLVTFSPGPPAQWHFVVSAGDGRAAEIVVTADMLEQRNTTVLRVQRPAGSVPFGKDLPEEAAVALIVRFDIEDRNFHTETHRNSGAEHHFASHTRPLSGVMGFEFTPAADRHLRVFSDAGVFNAEAEWGQGIPHPCELTRGQVGEGDAFSPGWFEVPLSPGSTVHFVLCADESNPAPEEVRQFEERRRAARAVTVTRVGAEDAFGRRLTQAVQAFVVRRGTGKTIIAGYPWFLDWGRDSLICARGLLAAGMVETVRDLLVLFGRFAENGTLPNNIHGEDASNRDTSDAPLWYGVVCEDLAAQIGSSLYATTVDQRGRTITDTLREIARGYRDGTANGIRMDAGSGLIWSPSHFTWMDTNHPAATPREGYPVEIQVLWIRLLRQLARLGPESAPWEELAARATESFQKYFWLEERGYWADLLVAKPNQSAAEARPDNALRSNYLFAISLGLVTGERARRGVNAALQQLVVPGALRSLAPLPVAPPLPILSADGRLLNNPVAPYCGRYEGDEDTRRKLAYHNGTAWTWTFPTWCEALVAAWDSDPAAVAGAKSFLSSLEYLFAEGCIGQLPEITDGDTPHTQRGCDAQAWSVTEALRVWKLLREGTKREIAET
jgi:predicted glycogen debranching enzyme